MSPIEAGEETVSRVHGAVSEVVGSAWGTAVFGIVTLLMLLVSIAYSF